MPVNRRNIFKRHVWRKGSATPFLGAKIPHPPSPITLCRCQIFLYGSAHARQGRKIQFIPRHTISLFFLASGEHYRYYLLVPVFLVSYFMGIVFAQPRSQSISPPRRGWAPALCLCARLSNWRAHQNIKDKNEVKRMKETTGSIPWS